MTKTNSIVKMLKKCTLLSLVLLFLLLTSSCKKEPVTVNENLFAMDTLIKITAIGSDNNKVSEVTKIAMQKIRDIAYNSDRYGKDKGDIFHINENAGKKAVKVSEDIFNIVSFVKEKNSSLVDISVGPLVDMWNINRDTQKIPSKEDVKKALSYVSLDNVVINKEKKSVFLNNNDMSLDLGSVAKGYAVEEAAKIIRKEKSVTGALVDGGGNIKVIGSKPDGKPWRIGIQDPRDLSMYIGVLKLSDNDAVSTSGDYQRYYEINGQRYHHLLDLRTGMPASKHISVTIFAPSAFLADYYSTFFFMLDLNEIIFFVKENPSIQAVIVDEDRKIYITEGLKDKFEKSDGQGYEYIQK